MISGAKSAQHEEHPMDYFAGIDSSLETANICIVDQDGTVLREQKVECTPEALINALKAFRKQFKRVGLEAGPLSTGCTETYARLASLLS
jgi:transposase